MGLKELRQRRIDLRKEAEAVAAMTDGEAKEAKWAGVVAQMNAVNAQVEKEEFLLDAERSIPTSSIDPEKLLHAQKKEFGADKVFASVEEQFVAIYNAGKPGGRIDPRLISAAATGINEQVGSEGAFLVQADFSQTLFQKAWETSALASRCDRRTVVGNGIAVPGIDEKSRADGSRHGGISVSYVSEGGQASGTRPKFQMVEAKLKKQMALVYLTDEMLEDAGFVAAWVADKVPQEMAFVMDAKIFEGTGVGEPQGFINSGAVVTVAKEGAQTADTINIQNIVKMHARMPAALRGEAVWLINQDAEPQLPLMTLGGSAAAYPVFLPSVSIAGVPGQMLYGKQLVASEHAATVGDLNDITLVNLSQYLLIQKGTVRQDVSMHVRFDYAEQVFRFIHRHDGRSLWKEAVSPRKGTNKQSPFINLEAR